ncbi:MAG: hypothetical protein KDG89_03845 [Geminicoccaceae bacterium]|nr:hypothetical protein [Geminicoccaceae bacterium]
MRRGAARPRLGWEQQGIPYSSFPDPMLPARFAAICAEVGINESARVAELFNKVQCATVYFRAAHHYEETCPSTNEVQATFDTIIDLCNRLYAFRDGMDDVSYHYFAKAAEDLQWAALNGKGNAAAEMRDIGALRDAWPEGLLFMDRREAWVGIRYLRLVAMKARGHVPNRQAGRKHRLSIQFWIERVGRACIDLLGWQVRLDDRAPIGTSLLEHFLVQLMNEIEPAQARYVRTGLRRYRASLKHAPHA